MHAPHLQLHPIPPLLIRNLTRLFRVRSLEGVSPDFVFHGDQLSAPDHHVPEVGTWQDLVLV